MSDAEQIAVATLQRIADSQVAFNAHPVGVIVSMQDWAKEALREIATFSSAPREDRGKVGHD